MMDGCRFFYPLKKGDFEMQTIISLALFLPGKLHRKIEKETQLPHMMMMTVD